VRPENVLQERLIEPDGAHRAAVIADERFEDFETWSPGGAEPAALNPSGNRDVTAGCQAGNRLEASPIFVSKGKTMKEIFDACQPDPPEIGGASRPDALQILKRRLEKIFRQSVNPGY
jgi:hypothetical protein